MTDTDRARMEVALNAFLPVRMLPDGTNWVPESRLIALREALEAEWYNGNLDEKAYDRLLEVAGVDRNDEARCDCSGWKVDCSCDFVAAR